MKYVLLLYQTNKYKKQSIYKAIGPFDTEEEAMDRTPSDWATAYTGVQVVPVHAPEDI